MADTFCTALPSRHRKVLWVWRRVSGWRGGFDWCSRGESLSCSRNRECYFALSRVSPLDMCSSASHGDSALASHPQVINNPSPLKLTWKSSQAGTACVVLQRGGVHERILLARCNTWNTLLEKGERKLELSATLLPSFRCNICKV